MKKKIIVLSGNFGSEKEISALTAEQVIKNIDKNKYEAISVTLPGNRDPSELLQILNKQKVDAVFIAMHGEYGEDGCLQGMLEFMGVPYTGPGVLASSLGMDKILFKEFVKQLGYKVPKHIIVNDPNKIYGIKKLGSYPLFVKPYDRGSSVGSYKVQNLSELKKAVAKALTFSEKALIEEYISGKELTVSVIGNNSPKALPVIEIVPLKGDFFDYKSKYTVKGADEIVPARIDTKITKETQNVALDIYKKLGCKGFSRVDFILKDKNLYVLEINTIPGLTTTSLFPKSAKFAGMSYSDLIDEVIRLAIEK